MRIRLLFLVLALATACFAQWSDDPLVNNAICTLTGEQAVPKVAHCPDGSMYIGWYDNSTGNYDVRLQHLAYDGAPLWATIGLVVSSHEQASSVTDWSMTTDSQGACIIAFQDFRSNDAPNVVVYKITPTGQFAWGDDGLQLTNDTAENYIPRLAVTDSDNVIVAWMAGDNVCVQKISSDGTPQLTTPLVLTDDTCSYKYPQPMAVSGDAFLLKYYKDTGVPWAPTRHVFVNKYDSNVSPAWTGEVGVSTQGGISAWTQELPLIPDGSGGMWTGWYDDRDSNGLVDSYVTHIAADGTLTFGDGGQNLTSTTGMQNYMPSLCASADGVYAFWKQTNSGQSSSGLVAQRVTVDGVLWNAGVSLVGLSSRVVDPIGAGAVDGEAVVIYRDDGSTGTDDNDIRAQRVNAFGDSQWTTDMSTVASDKLHASTAESGVPQWVAVWGDERGESRDIYAQNITAIGVIGVVSVPSGIEGTVTLNGPGDVTQVDISVNGIMSNPGPNGTYNIIVDPGTYDVTFTLNGYQSHTETDVVIEEETFTVVNAALTWIPPSGINGTVTLDGGDGTVTDVTITIDGNEYQPSGDGSFSIEVDPGTYDVTFALEDYQTVTEEDVVVVASTFTDLDVTLEYIQAAGEDTPPLAQALSARPNPFNPETTVVFSLTRPGVVALEVFDVRGRHVATLASGDFEAGEHTVVWNAQGVSSGVYFARLRSAEGEKTTRLLLLK